MRGARAGPAAMRKVEAALGGGSDWRGSCLINFALRCFVFNSPLSWVHFFYNYSYPFLSFNKVWGGGNLPRKFSLYGRRD